MRLNRQSWCIPAAEEGIRYTFRDLYIDVMVPTDGRPYRLLDLDEYADAIEDGTLSVDVAVDGLRRWQLFLDRYPGGPTFRRASSEPCVI